MDRVSCRPGLFLSVALLLAAASTALAQSSAQPATKSPAPTPTATAPTPLTNAVEPAPPHTGDRLSVRMKLSDGVRTWHPARSTIGVSYAEGSDDSPAGQFRFTVDRAKLRHYLTDVAAFVHHWPQNATVKVAPGADWDAEQPAAIVIPGHNGGILDVDAAVDTVANTIETDPGTLAIDLPIKGDPPKITTEMLQGINARIGFFVTHFNPGEVGRTETVRRAIDIINGTVVPPGGIFSINGAVGERTAERGFGSGFVFVNGKMDVQLGGGMCQVATTLFNAAMLADLKIVERHQHVRTVPYVAPGRDATVYWGEKDFKFQNDTGAPVFISYKTTYTHAIVSLYGKATPGRKVRLVSHSRRLGDRHYTGVFYRVVTEPDGTVQKDTPFYSAYKWTPALDYSH